MTNKVKPFYIKITDDMTPQMVQDAFDKCVDAGVEVVGNIHDWNFIGLRNNGIVHVSMFESCFHGIKRITLDKLDEWLGLSDVVEWKNGDECMIRGEKLIYIGGSVEADIHCVQELGTRIYRNAHISAIEKPETPEQKAEREKKEEAKEMIQCLLDNYTACEDSAVEYVIDYLKECNSLGK